MMDNIATAESGNNFNGKITGFLQKYPVILQLLRFGAIGILNTALDFLVLNFISKTLGISSGLKLGQINVAGFILAVIQSYFWNKYWAFGQASQGVTVFKNFVRLVLVGVLGATGFALVLLGAKITAPASYYLLVLIMFVVLQLLLWHSFDFLNQQLAANQADHQFLTFIVVSVIGLLINSAIVVVISKNVVLFSNLDLNKNVAKILATFVSLVWNFVGYKLVVFKR